MEKQVANRADAEPRKLIRTRGRDASETVNAGRERMFGMRVSGDRRHAPDLISNGRAKQVKTDMIERHFAGTALHLVACAHPAEAIRLAATGPGQADEHQADRLFGGAAGGPGDAGSADGHVGVKAGGAAHSHGLW